MDLLVEGMAGLGDNLHQRAVVRSLTKHGHAVYLKTPWPQIYHDMLGHGLRVYPSGSPLRTQARNESAATRLYSTRTPPPGAKRLRVWYTPEAVRKHGGSVLRAMLASCGVPETEDDFRIPVPAEWINSAQPYVARLPRPILFYRPLVERTEWTGCSARNPDAYAYGTLAASLSERFSVATIADIVAGREWISGADIPSDLRLVNGELGLEALIGMAASADLILCSPGFAAVLGQAVGTPVVCVFGGYENSASFSAGAKWAPYLGIDTINPCSCFQHAHGCEKRIDLPAALQRLKEFTDAATSVPTRAA